MGHIQDRSVDGAIGGNLQLRRTSRAFCPICDKQVDLVAFGRAAELFHTDLQDIEFLIKHGDVHQIHNRRGQVMACSPSLFECFEIRRTRLLDSGIIKDLAVEGPL